VHLFHPKSLKHTFIQARKFEHKNMTTRRVVTNNYREQHAPFRNFTHSTRLTPQQIDQIRTKGLCFDCENKYSKRHKCHENKLFYMYCDEEEYRELELSRDLELEKTTPTISCHALASFITPQTFKLEENIKNKRL